jgi:hypothetical protein
MVPLLRSRIREEATFLSQRTEGRLGSEKRIQMKLLIGSFQDLRGLPQVRYPRSPNQAITSLCAVAWVLCTEMPSLPETCNSAFVPIRPESDPCSDSSASTMLPSPLPESSHYVVLTKANLPSAPYASKTKLCPLSGMLSCLHRSILLQHLTLPIENTCTESKCAHYQKHVIPLCSNP